jgi:hypothetical protein
MIGVTSRTAFQTAVHKRRPTKAKRKRIPKLKAATSKAGSRGQAVGGRMNPVLKPKPRSGKRRRPRVNSNI